MMKPTKFVGGTSEKEWELLADITTQEEVNTIDITQALDETLFSNLNLTEMFIFFRVKPTEDVDNDYGLFIVNDKNIQVGQQFSLYTNGQFRYFSAYFKLFKNGDAVIQFKDNNNSALASNTGGFQFQFAFGNETRYHLLTSVKKSKKFQLSITVYQHGQLIQK